ncbi:MAG: hypothetical protein ACXV2H_03305 [Actinomycetes bacterium]
MTVGAPASFDRPRGHILRRAVLLTATAITAAGALTYGVPDAAPSAAPVAGASLRPQFQHVDPPPAGVDVTDRLSVSELYEAAGLGSPAQARALADSVPDGSVVPPGAPSTSGLVQHVARSCAGDGTDGKRVQVLYLRTTDQPDRLTSVRSVIENEVANVDDVIALSAEKAGGERRVRWVQDAGCHLVIVPVALPAGSLGGDFGATISALQADGFTSPDRKYLAFSEGTALCGVGTMYPDSSPTDNVNERYPGYARVDQGCWSRVDHSTPAHELMHTLGAVNDDAPNSSGYGHCVDESDLMCYADAPGVTTRSICPPDQEALLDCGGDDYFSTAPAPGSYLQTHWNVASSAFLDTVSASGVATSTAPTAPAPTPTAPSTSAGAATTFTAAAKPGYPAAVYATLRNATTGQPLAAQPVSLRVSWVGTRTWQTMATNLRTDPKGKVTVSFAPTRAGRYGFTFAGTPSLAAAATGAVVVKVPTRISAAVRRGPARVSGRLTTGDGTALRSTYVALQSRTQGSSTWRQVTRLRSDSHGNLVARVRASRTTYYRWSYAATTTHAAARSRRVRLTG